MLNRSLFEEIWDLVLKIQDDSYSTSFSQNGKSWANKVAEIIDKKTVGLPLEQVARIQSEFFGYGPLESLLAEKNITEILVNSLQDIWFEEDGYLKKHHDFFFSKTTFNFVFERMCLEANIHINAQRPFADANFRNYRFSIAGGDVSGGQVQFSLRQHPENPWSLDKLIDEKWTTAEQGEKLKELIQSRKNFLVVGGTGSGKTSVCNALLNKVGSHQRVMVIEDTREIKLPNGASTRLLTRMDPNQELPDIDQGQLVRRALRLRPDRIVLGEIRGAEAKDLLLALTTGHPGSFSTLHAEDAAQALIRLEMLIQLGAPQWSLQAVRRLIQMSLHCIVVVQKTAEGHRRLKGLYKISSLEDQGFLLDPL